jgi:peptidoglycan/xylan/chitin deacetylase (PgdA/CDA1 family)
VHAIWPQIDVYDPADLARRCREAKIAIALHPNRGELMIRSSPAEVRSDILKLVDVFTMAEGGTWFYVEIDSGFPFQNVQALIETIGELRSF